MKTLTGVVTSKSAQKSLRVVVDFEVKHPKYEKYVRRQTKLGVHDEHNEANEGDMVQVAECRSKSKTKSWRLVKVLERAPKRSSNT